MKITLDNDRLEQLSRTVVEPEGFELRLQANNIPYVQPLFGYDQTNGGGSYYQHDGVDVYPEGTDQETAHLIRRF